MGGQNWLNPKIKNKKTIKNLIFLWIFESILFVKPNGLVPIENSVPNQSV